MEDAYNIVLLGTYKSTSVCQFNLSDQHGKMALLSNSPITFKASSHLWKVVSYQQPNYCVFVGLHIRKKRIKLHCACYIIINHSMEML